MKVSLNTIRQYINFDLPATDELVARIDAQLGVAEGVVELKEKYHDAVIVRVVSAEKHPDADKLQVCRVDDGGVVDGVERDADGYVQVVCGAPNARADMFAVWLPPRATVPSTFEDAEPFVLSERKLRGVMSYGMLAGGDELAINDDHSGIVEVTASDMPQGVKLAAGVRFGVAFGLDDTIIDIENKMFTHRPDCFGQLGVAREIAGIFGNSFTSPEWYSADATCEEGTGVELHTFNDAREKAPRFMAVALQNVTVAPSPLWLQCALVSMGSKSINNIVDITNYMMLVTAQPMHAYDYDKLAGGTLGVRRARDGETLLALNDKEYTLTTDDIIIADAEKPVGIGGVIGGKDSQVTEQTRTIVLECANFDMYALRKASMRHGLFTDAVTRFNKGQSPLQCSAVMARAIQYMQQLSGASVASSTSDIYDTLPEPKAVSISSAFVNDRLGGDMSTDTMRALLQNVEIATEANQQLHITAPFWRTDITLKEDVVEEIGRLHGYDKLPRALPVRSAKPAIKNTTYETKKAIRASMSRMGANEALTYSFVHEKVLTNARQNPEHAYRLGNALSPDLQYYRLTVLPSLLDKVHANIKAGHDTFALYEIGKGHNKIHDQSTNSDLPDELEFVDMVYASKEPKEGAPFYRMRHMVDQLCRDLGYAVVYTPVPASAREYAIVQPFDCDRSALVTTEDGRFVGMIGEIAQPVRKRSKLPDYTAAASLDLQSLCQLHSSAPSRYTPLSRYPSTSQDVSIEVDAELPYQHLYEAVKEASNATADDIRVTVTPVSIYKKDEASAKKTITMRLDMVSHERTLRADDAKAVVAAATAVTI